MPEPITLDLEPQSPVLDFVERLVRRPEHRARLVRAWKSSKADLYHYRIDDDPPSDVVVKRMAAVDDAASSFHALNRLADFIEGAGHLGLRAVRPLAFDDSIGAMAMPYITGTVAGDIVRGDSRQLDALVERVAVAMAGVHRLSRVASPSEVAMAVADERMRRLTGVAHVGSNGRRPHPRPSDLVRRLIDFNPNNMVLVEGGDLCLFDPHIAEDLYVYAHQDVVAFLYKTYKRLISKPWSSARLGHALVFRRLVDRFLRTYFASSDRPMEELDARVVHACLDGYTRLTSPSERGRHRVARLLLNDWLLRQEARATRCVPADAPS